MPPRLKPIRFGIATLIASSTVSLSPTPGLSSFIPAQTINSVSPSRDRFNGAIPIGTPLHQKGNHQELIAIELPNYCSGWSFGPTVRTQAKPALKTPKAAADEYLDQGLKLLVRGDLFEACRNGQKALTFYQRIQDRSGETRALVLLGDVFQAQKNYQGAIAYYESALRLIKQFQDQNEELRILTKLSNLYLNLAETLVKSNQEKAIALYQKALPIARLLNDRYRELQLLIRLGNASSMQRSETVSYTTTWDRNILSGKTFSLLDVDRSSSEHKKAIPYYQQALALVRQLNDRNSEVQVLMGLGDAYNANKEYGTAMGYYQQVLPIYQELKNRNGEIIILLRLGDAANAMKSHETAIQYYQQALPIYQQINNRSGEAGTLLRLGRAAMPLTQYDQASTYFQQAVTIYQQVNAPKEQAIALNELAAVYLTLSQYDQAIATLQQALTINQQLKDRNNTAAVLSNLAQTYWALSQPDQAITYLQQALGIYEQTKNAQGKAQTLRNLGNAYQARSQYDPAIAHLQQALSIYQNFFSAQAGEDRNEVAEIRISLGEVYQAKRQYDQAATYFQQALTVYQRVKNPIGEAKALKALGTVYWSLSQHDKAISYFQQALPIYRQLKNRAGEAKTLADLGEIYAGMAQYDVAIAQFEPALSIYQQVKDPAGEALLRRKMATTLLKQQRPESAIVFYKQSVNLWESIRARLRTLPRDVQESYTQSVAGTYRELADLLLAQGRVLEAQQVLELLKIQELQNYNSNTRAGGTTSGIDFDATERKILQAYNSLIDFGQKIRDCQTQAVACTDAELNQLIQLRSEQTAAIQQILQGLAAQLTLRTTQDKSALDPKNQLSRKAQEIIRAQRDTVLIYSLVTNDRLWVVLAAEGDVLRKFEVKVTQQQLADAVLKFRQLIKACESRPCGTADLKPLQVVSQQLYNWMLPPELQKELQGKGTRKRPIRNLVFAPDRVTRYIPFAALFDGKQYLIEQYAVSSIVSASLTDTKDRLPTNPQQISVLALGLSNPAPPDFGALPNVPLELRAIVKQPNQKTGGVFKGVELLNQQFDWLALQKNLVGRTILHIATHGKFIPGSFESSYLLLGTGAKLPIAQIEQLSDLVDVHLVVLSACETALGGKREQDGLEIAGISNSFLERGAKAVLASLWQVNDASTSLLMQRFYQNLATGKMTKAEALRQAQRSLLQASGKASAQGRGNFRIETKPSAKPAVINRDLSHPYYWAPFILIGNGL